MATKLPLADRKNKSDRILTRADIVAEMPFEDLPYKDFFSYYCDLVPDQAGERLLIKNAALDTLTKQGMLYAFVIDDKVVKIGSSITSFKKRVQSYNCGRQAYRDKGTCSVTNYHVLQSFLKINKRIKVYCYFPAWLKVKVFGENEIVSPAKLFEKKLLTHLKKNHRLPIMCTQQ